MEILIGKTAGFCYGVQRAVDGAKNELQKNREIVHNKQVINELENMGITFISDVQNAKNKLIIRAHGEPKQTYSIAKKQNIEIIDFTCPNVLKIHNLADEYSKNNFFIFLCGSKKHPENIGTISYCGTNVFVIENVEDVPEALKHLKKSKKDKLLLISQTTYSLENFEKIEDSIKSNLSSNIEIVIKNTICNATVARQKETKELSSKVDAMIIIGGINSSNTKKLYEIASSNCKNTIAIQTCDDINLNTLLNINTIGVMAGASTPKKSIEDVINKLNQLNTIKV